MLLSIVIPAYGRADTLRRALDVFINQAAGKYENDIEIIVADDASPGNSLAFASEYACKHSFIRYHRYDTNIGLERNLVACTRYATGEFLWLFGDDDYLETDDALDEIMERLRRNEADFFIFNRTRRNKDLSKLLTPNWMELDGPDRKFSGLREFYLNFGFISVIGFISVNIFRRVPYVAVNATRYVGTMYPQLGAMTEAFHSRPVVLVSKPLICQRTQTQQEKQEELKAKPAEADFMTDADRRNALYFSHPHTAMLDVLISKGAMLPGDVVCIRENTVITGLLVEFLVACIEKSVQYADRFTPTQWRQTKAFLGRLPLSQDHAARVNAIFRTPAVSAIIPTASASDKKLSISVVSPSFNQAEFLGDCLKSVRDQSYSAIEHLVFDPGSKDASRAIAKTFPHVKLFEEADGGQSDAVNKGWSRARGDIVAWLNSDDMLFDSEVFKKVVDRFNAPDAPDIVYGKGIYINESDEKLRDIYVNEDAASLPWKLQQECGISQPALFMRRSVIERVGKLTPSNHFSMDYEYWIRCTKAGIKFAYVNQDLSIARYHSSNKTYGQRGKSYAEVCEMLLEQYGYVSRHWLRRYAEFIADGHDGVLANAGNAGARDLAKLEDAYDRLLMRYNCGVIPFALLDAHSGEQSYGDTWNELKRRGLDPAKAAAAGVQAYVRVEPAAANPRKRVSIAIVTPNYNTGAFIESTMDSVLGQGYPNLQYVVVDGASTDGSQKLIEARQSELHAYVSEPDKGHADAIVKGFALTDGAIMGWVNSDDILLPGALDAVARFFEENPEIDWITGRPSTIEENGAGFRQYPVRQFSRLRFLAGHYKWIQQESTFWRRSLWEKAGGGLDTSIRYAVDMDLWVRFFRHAELHSVEMPVGAFRQRQGQRSVVFLDAYEKESAGLVAAEVKSLDADYSYWFAAVLPAEPGAIAGEELARREPWLRIADTSILKPESLLQSAGSATPVAVTKPRISGEDWRAHLTNPDDLSGFKNRHTGKRCFVMGNGPSLNKMDLDKLNGEIVFGCNSVFLLFDRVKWRPTYYTCVDSRVLPDRRTEIDAMLKTHPDMVAFLPSAIRQYTGENRRYLTRLLVPPGTNRYFFNEKRQSMDALPCSMFSTDANDGLVQPFTVTVTMLQLAHYMGFSEIYLIGCDTSYVIPNEVVKEGRTLRGELGLALTSTEDNDPNHFDPRYFGKGRQWHDPQTEKMIEHYGYARQVCELRGSSKIYNATVGGNLEVFERIDFNTLFGGAAVTQPPPKPITPPTENYIRPVTVSRAAPQPQLAVATAEDTGLPRDVHAEVDETGVVAHMLKDRRGPSHVMIDVGAHIGTSARYFDKLGWAIHCFEPDPVNRKNLIERFGESPNVIIDARAISDEPATSVPFFKSEESTGISGLHAFRDSHAESGLVDVTTIAEIVGTRGIVHVDFLKIDVEGFDFSVLKGVPWAKLRPDVIECEYEDAKTVPLGHTWEDIAKFLSDLGYAIYISEWHPIVRYGIAHDWRRVMPYPGRHIPSESWGNLLAFRIDPGFAAVKESFEACLARRDAPPQLSALQEPPAPPPEPASLFGQRPVPRTGQSPGAVSNGRDSYVRSTQLSVHPGSAAAAGSDGGPVAETVFMKSGPLTIFPICSKSSNGGAALDNAPVAPVTPGGGIRIEMRPPAAVIQGTTSHPEAANPYGRQEPKPRAPTLRPGAGRDTHDLARWIKSHVLRRRAAQAVIAVVVGLLIGGGFLLAMPEQGDLRPMLVAITSLVLLGVGGLYFAYRTLGLAQRLSAENATLQQRLLETSGLVADLERETRGESQRQATTTSAIATRIEKSVVTSLQTVEQRISQLDAALHSELVQLKGAQAGVAQELGATTSRLADANARAEMLVGELQQLKELHSATKLALDRVHRQQGDDSAKHASLADDFVASSAHLQWLAGKTDDLVADVGELKEMQSRTNTGVGALNENATSLSAAIEVIRHRQEDLAQDAAATQALVASEAEYLSQVAERVSYIEDLAKDMASTTTVQAAEFGRRIEESHKAFHVAKRTIEMIGARVADVAAVSEQVTLEVSHALDGLEKKVVSVEGRLTSAEAVGAAEITSLTRQIAEGDAKNEDRLSQIDGRVADVAGLSQQAALEVSHALGGLEKKVVSVEGRLTSAEEIVASAEAAGAAEITSLTRQIAEVDSKVSAQLAPVVALVASKADSTALEELAKLHAGLAEAVAVSEEASIREWGAFQERLDSIAQSKVGVVEFAQIERDVADLASLSSQAAQDYSRIDTKISTMMVEVSTFGGRLDPLRAELSEIRINFSELSGVVNAVEAEAANWAQKIAWLDTRQVALGDALASAELAGAGEVALLKEGHATLVNALASAEASGEEEVARIEQTISALDAAVASKIDNMQSQLESATAVMAERAELFDIRRGIATLEEKTSTVSRDAARGLLDVGKGLTEAEKRLTAAVSNLATKASQEELADLSRRFDALGVDVAGAKAQGVAQVESIEHRISTIGNQLAELTTLSEQVGRQNFQEMDNLARDLSEERAKTNGNAEQLTVLSTRLNEVDKRLSEESEELSKQIANATSEITAATAMHADVGQVVASLTRSLDDSVKRIESEASTAMIDNTTIYQRFNRKLQLAHIETLESEWVRKLSLSVPRMAFGYMAARAVEVERELDGRLATSIEDVLLRTLVARATKGGSVRVLEIGTLFGTGAAIMFDALKNHYKKLHFTLLDPLDAYHSDGRADILTGQPVTEAVVRRNLAKAGMQDDQVRLITRLSTDSEAISEASEGLYDVLVIDADHSYAGVKSDFENYARLVRLGGHVIFNDYDSEDWPDVKAYVDAEMPDADFLTPVGNSWRTAVYRVIRSPEITAAPRRSATAKPAGTVPKRASTRKKS